MFVVGFPFAEAPGPFPGTDQPRQRHQFGGQVGGNLNGHRVCFFAAGGGGLLLALEEARDHEPGEAGHAQARDDQQGEEEDFKSKVFVHATILTASGRHLPLS
ncbi:hypothetical protein GCM10009715_17210 [Paeniglutamicibacter psychrophenolicus]